MVPEVFIALTDSAWFDFLREQADGTGRVDEVNFWSPSSIKPLKRLRPGSPVFFRLKRGRDAIAGYGFFAAHVVLRLDDAWASFGWRNGDPDEARFLERIGGYRELDLLGDPRASREHLGCTLLRDARFWQPERWISWREDQGWRKNLVRGKTETDPNRVSRLLGEITYDCAFVPGDLAPEPFEPQDLDVRSIVLARQVQREGQGTFRARLLDAYGRQCAVTGEHTEIVLDAAHIQPYLGPRSNHPAERAAPDEGVPRALRPRLRDRHP